MTKGARRVGGGRRGISGAPRPAETYRGARRNAARGSVWHSLHHMLSPDELIAIGRIYRPPPLIKINARQPASNAIDRAWRRWNRGKRR